MTSSTKALGEIDARLYPTDSSERYNMPQNKLKRLMALEGECKIQNIRFLQFSLVKTIILTFLAVISIVGFFMLVWFRWFRVRLWYSFCTISQASHVYIKGNDNDAVQQLTRLSQQQVTFYFNKLKYIMKKDLFHPVALDYQKIIGSSNFKAYLNEGLDTQAVQAQKLDFGLNQHSVQIPHYFKYMFDVLLQPFFLIQYLVCLAYIVQGYFLFAVLNFVFSVITTTINYILMYISFRKIKKMAQRVVDVKVLRNSEFVTIQSNGLVPGDLIDPQGQIMCDCIVVKGDVYVNQASLTGQNIPIGKYPLTKVQQIQQNDKWLFEGSKIIQKRGSVLALVVYTGYTTRRGRIIRKILTRKQKFSTIFKRTLLFLTQAFIVATIIYLATFTYTKSRNVVDLIVGFRYIDFLGWAFPPTFPIFFNVAYSYTLVRLKNNGILCTEPQKTVEGANLKIMCFDKTGTLTQNVVEVNKVYAFNNQGTFDITNNFTQSEYDLVWKLFATCHTTIKSRDTFLGDQIDLRMFLFSKYQMVVPQNSSVKFQVKNQLKKHNLQVLRINQFEAKFQSMSVLIRDKNDNKFYSFIKGAPERIYSNSVLKINHFDEIIKSQSLGGFRTIAFGYRVVHPLQVQKYIQGQRDIFEKDINILGIVSFENKLKSDARQTIRRLTHCEIQPKIITGDNIYIAIETGVRAGIINQQDPVIILQGRKQNAQEQNVRRIFKGTILHRKDGKVTQQQIQINQGQNYQNLPIAVDNSFVKLNPPPVLTSNMKLFARISPQNKALIVKKFKQKINEQFNQRSLVSRLTGQLKKNVGMCGDGANDLMAIRESDVGMGINNSDASYAAMFSIQRLLDVEYIVRDSKATVTNIVEMILYYQLITFLRIPSSLMMLTDTSYFSSSQINYYSFSCSIVFPVFMPMSRPSNIITSAKPKGNLFGPLNHLQFWGSIIICTGGLSAGYFYFKQTPGFILNPRPYVINDWYQQTHSATCMFLLILLLYTVFPVVFYTAYPWKKNLWRNYILTILIILNVAASITFYYITSQASSAFKFVPIVGYDIVSILLSISLGTCILSFIYNKILTKLLNSSNGTEQEVVDQIYETDQLKINSSD